MKTLNVSKDLGALTFLLFPRLTMSTKNLDSANTLGA